MKECAIVFSLIFMFLSRPVRAQTVESATICEAIENNDAKTPKTQFEKGARAYCWIKIKDAPAGSKILVVWYCNDQLQHSTTLPLNYPNMRTYAYKTLHHPGQWRADIKKADGTLLKSLSFVAGSEKLEEQSKSAVVGAESKKESAVSKEISVIDDGNANIVKEPSTVVLPPNYDKNKTYPAVIMLPYTGGESKDFLAFYGGWGDDEKDQLSKLLGSFYPDKKTRQSKEFILILPAGRGSEADHTWQGFEAAIERYENKILSDLKAFGPKYNIDPKAVIITGFSLGGDLSWALSMRNPDVFCGAVVMGSRCSYPGKGNLSVLAKNGFRFFLVMGEFESDVRLKIFNQSKDLLDANKVSYIFKSVPGESHAGAPPDMFREALEFVLFSK